MDFKVTFSQRSLRDLAEIVTFIGRENSEAAREWSDKLLKQTATLGRFPFRYSKDNHRSEIRKMPLPPYLVYYRVNEQSRVITIIHFWHGARQHPLL